jgi:hypothetical protein
MAKHCLRVFKAKRILQQVSLYARNKRYREMKGYLFWYNSLMARSVTAWKRHLINKRDTEQLIQNARVYYRNRTIEHMFRAWKAR